MFRRAETDPELFRQRQTAAAGGAAAAGIDLSALASIFFLLSKEMLSVLFEQSLKFVLLPIAGLANIAQMGFAWRNAYLNRFEGHSTATAVIKTVTAILINAAVIGSLVASAAFAVAGPAIFVAAFGMNTLFNLGSSIYFGVKAAMENDPAKKAEFRGKAIEAGVGTVVAAIATVGIAAVMLVGKVGFAILAIVGGVAGGALAIKKSLEIANQNPPVQNDAAPAVEQANDREFSTNARIAHTVGLTRNSSGALLIDPTGESEEEDLDSDSTLSAVVDNTQQIIASTSAPKEDPRDASRTSNGMK